MGEWGWVIVGYVAMVGTLGVYTLALRRRLVRARERSEELG